MAAPQLQTVTTDKQTCSICLQTIRKNSTWWHETECTHPHYFHWDCWHDYHKHICAKDNGDETCVPCPVCRHPQMSKSQLVSMILPVLEIWLKNMSTIEEVYSELNCPFSEEIGYRPACQTDPLHSGATGRPYAFERSEPNIWSASQIRRENHCCSHEREMASRFGRHDFQTW